MPKLTRVAEEITSLVSQGPEALRGTDVIFASLAGALLHEIAALRESVDNLTEAVKDADTGVLGADIKEAAESVRRAIQSRS